MALGAIASGAAFVGDHPRLIPARLGLVVLRWDDVHALVGWQLWGRDTQSVEAGGGQNDLAPATMTGVSSSPGLSGSA